ncbi:hypothetical protein Tco_1228713 [Tanacetum coccineum]
MSVQSLQSNPSPPFLYTPSSAIEGLRVEWDCQVGMDYKVGVSGYRVRIDEALDYRVKEFRVNKRNSGLDTRFWTNKDVDRSKEFMFAIQKRLKTRRIFRNLESFVGGRIREGDYRLLKRTE